MVSHICAIALLWPECQIGNGCAKHTFTWTIIFGSSLHEEPPPCHYSTAEKSR
jgi:hypothetical protein